MNKIAHYGVFLALLYSIVGEWNDIAKIKVAAILGLIATFFYLFFIFCDINDTHFPDREVDRKTRFLRKKRARQNAYIGLGFTFLFFIFWSPHSPSLPIVAILCAFLCLGATLVPFSLNTYQGNKKKKSARTSHPLKVST